MNLQLAGDQRALSLPRSLRSARKEVTCVRARVRRALKSLTESDEGTPAFCWPALKESLPQHHVPVVMSCNRAHYLRESKDRNPGSSCGGHFIPSGSCCGLRQPFLANITETFSCPEQTAGAGYPFVHGEEQTRPLSQHETRSLPHQPKDPKQLVQVMICGTCWKYHPQVCFI